MSHIDDDHFIIKTNLDLINQETSGNIPPDKMDELESELSEKERVKKISSILLEGIICRIGDNGGKKDAGSKD